MSLCFLTGCPHDDSGRPTVKVLHAVEYLAYDLKNGRVEVTADFFAHNRSKDRARVYGLHQGRIPFSAGTGNWTDDERWTGALRRIAGEPIGLRIDADKKIRLYGTTEGWLEVGLLPDAGNVFGWPWAEAVTETSADAYFTPWQSQEIEPGHCSLFRIAGTLQGPSYKRLVPEGDRKHPIKILGGNPLEESVLSDLTSGCCENQAAFSSAYKRFTDDFLDPPDFYHVFLERMDGGSLHAQDISTDMREGQLDYVFNKRRISWYWFDADFSIHARANGPMLALASSS